MLHPQCQGARGNYHHHLHWGAGKVHCYLHWFGTREDSFVRYEGWACNYCVCNYGYVMDIWDKEGDLSGSQKGMGGALWVYSTINVWCLEQC